jgi:hypothetical protein
MAWRSKQDRRGQAYEDNRPGGQPSPSSGTPLSEGGLCPQAGWHQAKKERGQHQREDERG